MLIDARLVTDQDIIETEVCIVGSGPAAMTLAHEFAGQNFRVCLLEGGGTEGPNAETLELNAVKTQGDFVQVVQGDRNFQLGGNSSVWGVAISKSQEGLRLAPLDEVDFESRDWLPDYCGWPFDRNHLMPFYERAQKMFHLKGLTYKAEDWATAEAPQIPFKGDRVTTKIFQFGPRAAFFQDHLGVVRQAKNITTYIHANAVELETDETGQTVQRVRVACLGGNQFWVAAKIVILAAGGVNTTQLLLLSDRVQKQGLGNDYDLVGRFFSDHPLVTGGVIIPSSPEIFKKTALYDLRSIDGISVMGALGLTNEVMRREKVLNTAAWLFPRSKDFRPPKSVASLKALLKKGNPSGSQSLPEHLGNVITGLDSIAAFTYRKLTRKVFYPHIFLGGWSELERLERMYDVFEVLHILEQAPHPDNRVVLSREVDPLGRRRVQMQTRLRDADIASIKRSQEIMAEEIARSGLGTYVIDRDGDMPVVERGGTAHHTGTTRMHVDPKQGVVDANCRVHSVSNLYIASSSVFPSSGYANPTLTLVAMSLRLADQIKSHMANDLNASPKREKVHI